MSDPVDCRQCVHCVDLVEGESAGCAAAGAELGGSWLLPWDVVVSGPCCNFSASPSPAPKPPTLPSVDCRACRWVGSVAPEVAAHCRRDGIDRPIPWRLIRGPCGHFEASPAPTLPLLEAARAFLCALGIAERCNQAGLDEVDLHCVCVDEEGCANGPAFSPGLCPACALRSAIAAEEERQKVRRVAAEAIVARLSRDAGHCPYSADVVEWAKMETSAASASPAEDPRDATIRDLRALLGRCATALERLGIEQCGWCEGSGLAEAVPMDCSVCHGTGLVSIPRDDLGLAFAVETHAALRSAGVEPTPAEDPHPAGGFYAKFQKRPSP